ncbi:bifunctional protein-serine/threonine kinase/phosphatase [Actinomadura gamaensis]|uniref:non-specific serine/threonine protein kinase n=1 Tax=Actinomadura gamaensis TaxID=1763541 RepID=A0ABV9TSQ4_9ACTN
MARGAATVAYRYAARSDAGMLRGVNGDSGYAGPHLLAVVDGGADVARAGAVSSAVIGALRELDAGTVRRTRLLSALERAVASADRHLGETGLAQPYVPGSGASLTAMLWSGDHLALAHVGNTRGYMLRDGELFQITHDHTLARLLADDGRIGEHEVITHPDRSVLLRALVGRGAADPDLSLREARLGDRYLLCSDGLHTVLGPEQIFEVLAGVADLDRAVRRLVEQANRRGGPDNITCVLADVVTGEEQDDVAHVAGAVARANSGDGGSVAVLGAPLPPPGPAPSDFGESTLHLPSGPERGPSVPWAAPRPPMPWEAGAGTASAGAEPAGFSLDGYEVFEKLGEGGNAAVYRARRTALGREVAIKLVHQRIVDERDRRRFQRELDACVRLSEHPNVVTLYDAGTLPEGRPYLVMELCPGGSLADGLRTRGPMPAVSAREIGIQVADALDAAHSHGVLHRDIKPANLLLTRFHRVALADFGIAALPVPGEHVSITLAMTPVYAAPEMFDDAPPSAQADVYSLGATVYALLAGRPPHAPERALPAAALVAHLLRSRGVPIEDAPGVPAPLMAVLRRALDADLGRRYRTAAEFRDALAATR